MRRSELTAALARGDFDPAMRAAYGAPLPAWVAPFIGIPWLDRGRTRAGIDCWGLCRLVYAEVFGIDLPSFTARYEAARDRVAVARLFFEEATSSRWRPVALDKAWLPDVITLSLAGERHAGIIVGAGRFLHVLAGRETCVERLRPHWIHRVEGVYRHEAFA